MRPTKERDVEIELGMHANCKRSLVVTLGGKEKERAKILAAFEREVRYHSRKKGAICMKEQESKPSKGKRPELLRRREVVSVLPRVPVWSDHRAWITSCVTHTFIFLLIALLWQPRTRGTGDVIDRPVGIAVVHASQSGEEYFLTGGPAEGSVAASAANASASLNMDAEGPPIVIAELLSDVNGYAGANANPSDSERGQGEGLSGLGTATTGAGEGSGATDATFMGLRGSGSSFVYVLDRSASMADSEGAPMRFAKKELLRSIQSLKDKNQFQIVFYNESPGSLNPSSAGGRMLSANELNKDRAMRFVQAITPLGGTEHIPGLKMGLSFSPNVVFFLTDAAEPAMRESQLIEIQDRADRSLTTIHTVQFNRGPAENDGGWIRQLAEMNRGTYRYVDILSIEQ